MVSQLALPLARGLSSQAKRQSFGRLRGCQAELGHCPPPVRQRRDPPGFYQSASRNGDPGNPGLPTPRRGCKEGLGRKDVELASSVLFIYFLRPKHICYHTCLSNSDRAEQAHHYALGYTCSITRLWSLASVWLGVGLLSNAGYDRRFGLLDIFRIHNDISDALFSYPCVLKILRWPHEILFHARATEGNTPSVPHRGVNAIFIIPKRLEGNNQISFKNAQGPV